MRIRVEPKVSRIIALKNMALISVERLNEVDIEKYPSNTLIDFYDIIHKLFEAISLKNGVKFKGEGAHFELINYVCDELDFSEKHRLLIQQIREYRNRISYEGFMIKENYIRDNKERLYRIINESLNYLNL